MFLITNFSIPQGLSIRDPLQSAIGRNILTNSVVLMDEIGFESFTFKKLAEKMGSNET